MRSLRDALPAFDSVGIASSVSVGLGLFLILRISLSLLAAASTVLFPVPPPCFHNGVVDWPTMPALYSNGIGGAFLGVWQRWDACWYLRLATFGYETGEPGAAFFPLYPLAIRIVGPLFGGNLVLAALAISGVSYIAAVALLHHMVKGDFDDATADRTVLYISIFPTAFFFFAPFTESLFLALALAYLVLARSGRFGTATLFGILVGLTRAQGAVVALPVAWEILRVVRAPSAEGRRSLTIASGVAATLAPLVGFAWFLGYGVDATGLSSLDAERLHWGFGVAPPWDILGHAWQWMLDPANAGFANLQLLVGLHLLLIGAFVALTIVGLRTLPPSYLLYVVPLLVLLVVSSPATPLASSSRYMLVMFPVFVVLARLGRNRWFDWALTVGSTLGLALLLLANVLNVPVG